MHRSSSSWFGWPKEELSSTERARQMAKRQSRLEGHMLHAQSELPPIAAEPNRQDLPRIHFDQRDPYELQSGVDVQVLSDSAFADLFPGAEPSRD